jgi:hypothetical protein
MSQAPDVSMEIIRQARALLGVKRAQGANRKRSADPDAYSKEVNLLKDVPHHE